MMGVRTVQWQKRLLIMVPAGQCCVLWRRNYCYDIKMYLQDG